VLEVEGLAKRYGDVLALRELSVRVDEGQCLVLLGRNGAGKTTALRCMAGVLLPTSGTITVDGTDAATDPAGCAESWLMPEVPGLYERMSARGYLDYFGAIYDIEPALRRRASNSCSKSSTSSMPPTGGWAAIPRACGRKWRSSAPRSTGRASCWPTSRRLP